MDEAERLERKLKRGGLSEQERAAILRRLAELGSRRAAETRPRHPEETR